MNFDCWTSGAWAAGSWVVGSWCPGSEPVQEGGAGYPIRRVPRFEFVDEEEEMMLLAIMGTLLND